MAFLSHMVAGGDQAGNWIEIYRSPFDPVASGDGVVAPFPAFHSSDSLAEAWIAATALLSQATLLHKDPEFEAIAELDQSWLA